MSDGRRAIYTESFLARLEEILRWYEGEGAGEGAGEFSDRLVKRLFEEVEPRLRAFPASGAPLRDLARIASLSPELLVSLDLPDTDVDLREVILEGHVLLYGFDETRLVFLFAKHGRQDGY